jgi:L-amino acid N-acyltransferase YncA
MDISIRSATPADALEMAEAYMRSWEVSYGEIVPSDFISEKRRKCVAQMEYMLSDEKLSPFQYVILVDGVIAGVMTVAPARDEGTDDNFYEIHGIYLHPDYFRRGIGTQVVEFACETARRLGKTKMILWVFEDNTNSINFYKKCGFFADGKSKILNCGKELSAIRMEILL